jgi:hypothetical protein
LVLNYTTAIARPLHLALPLDFHSLVHPINLALLLHCGDLKVLLELLQVGESSPQ